MTSAVVFLALTVAGGETPVSTSAPAATPVEVEAEARGALRLTDILVDLQLVSHREAPEVVAEGEDATETIAIEAQFEVDMGRDEWRNMSLLTPDYVNDPQGELALGGGFGLTADSSLGPNPAAALSGGARAGGRYCVAQGVARSVAPSRQSRPTP